MSAGQAGTLAIIAMFSSAVGGWFAGLLADRIGRVRTVRAIGIFSTSADAVLFIAALLRPGTRGKELA